ncbi:hypothetical protein [Teredinibacter purpureus]|uniref:hypothetical protein n=1 Tax=Teredinibacter purpureus TaxID=2731756 RepID=UPI0005F7D53F|nr:hypothetical protein [Teredinibacter purpureus]
MYSKDDIKPIDFKKHLADNEHMYFGSRGANPHSITCHIAEATLILGGTNAYVEKFEEWWFVSSGNDWLNAANAIDTNDVNVFESLRGFPEGGQNNYRGEIMAMYYSSALAISTNSIAKLIKGSQEDFRVYSKLTEQLKCNHNVLGFKFNAQL